MLRTGLARVYTFSDNRVAVQATLLLEHDARAARKGIWRQPFYAVRRVEAERQLMLELGTFQIVEGRIINAAQVRGQVYLNFGERLRSYFTATIEAKALRLFQGAGLDTLGLKGRHVRVRGWLQEGGGPAADLIHPEALEAVDAGEPDPAARCR